MGRRRQAFVAPGASHKRSLKERFEPATKKELYQAEFYARRKQKAEDWAALAEDLKLLASQICRRKLVTT